MMKKIQKIFLIPVAALVAFGCNGGAGVEDDSNPSQIASSATNDRSALGTNLDWGSWLSEFPFKDIFKQSMPWTFADTGAPAPLTREGWPQTDRPINTAMYLGVDGGHFPKGQYTCFYEGEGTLEFSGGARVISQSPGQIVLDVSTDEPIWLTLSAMNPSNPVRNIRVVMPGFESDYLAQPFHPLFLERLRAYKAIRFGGWQGTLSEINPIRNWADRVQPNHCTQAGDYGVALEYMIELANQLHADPWFNIPHQATDDFVIRFATMVRDRLNPGLKVTIEYSNEVWNEHPSFPQSQYADAQGMALNLASELPESTEDERVQKRLVAGRRFYSQRSVEVFNLWRQVFGSNERLVRVMATHNERPELAEMILDWRNAYQQTDALAIGGYFGGGMGLDQPAPSTVDGIFAELPAHIDEALRYVVAHRTIAQARGDIPVICYEGGQHLWLWGEAGPVTDRFIQANRDPRMREMYTRLLDGWRNAGGQLFMHLESGGQYSPNGSWGALEWYDQTSSPKHDALMQWIRDNPQWW